MTVGKAVKFADLPLKFKLSAKLERQANLVGTQTTYIAEALDEFKKTVLIKYGKGGNTTMKFTELNRNIKNGDWVVIK